MADVYVNALTTISTEPTTTDSLVAVNRNTNEGKIIDYNLLADAILAKLTSKQYSGLNTTSKLLVGAINELDSDVSSLNSSTTAYSFATPSVIKSLGTDSNRSVWKVGKTVYASIRTYNTSSGTQLSSQDVIFNIPDGYRPHNTIMLPCIVSTDTFSNSEIGILNVNPSGDVTVSGRGTYMQIWLMGTFPTDQ